MGEIVLDKKTFEALAIDTRVNIMKALKERRKTQSEIAKELSLAPSTISEHLEKMLGAGLITKKKDHHKWIYYELTEKGKTIISPQKTSIFVFALSMTLFAAVFAYMILSQGQVATPTLGAERVAAPSAFCGAPTVGTDWFLIGMLAVAVALFAFSIFYRFRKKRAVND